jgi:hypothetical protein
MRGAYPMNVKNRKNFLISYLGYYGMPQEEMLKMSLPELEQAYITNRIQRTPKTSKKVYGFIIPVS